MIRFLTMFVFGIFTSGMLYPQQGGTFGFESSFVEKEYNTFRDTENMVIKNYYGRPLKALQFKIKIIHNADLISDVSLKNGMDIPDHKFALYYHLTKGVNNKDISYLEISCLILGNDSYELKGKSNYDLVTLSYDVNSFFQDNDTISFILEDISGATSVPVEDAKIFAGSDLLVRLRTEKQLSETILLNQNYPNPFNPKTSISWQSFKSGWHKLVVYDLMGKEVSTLINTYLEKGSHNVDFSIKNLSSGIYFYQLTVSNENGSESFFSECKRMIYLK